MSFSNLIEKGLVLKVAEGDDIEFYTFLTNPVCDSEARHYFVSNEPLFAKDGRFLNHMDCPFESPAPEFTTDLVQKSGSAPVVITTLTYQSISPEVKGLRNIYGILIVDNITDKPSHYIRFKRPNALRGADSIQLNLASSINSYNISSVRILNTDTQEIVKLFSSGHLAVSPLKPEHPIFGTMTEEFQAGITNETYFRTVYAQLLNQSSVDMSSRIQRLGKGTIVSSKVSGSDNKLTINRVLKFNISEQELNKPVLYFSDVPYETPWGCVFQRFYPERSLGVMGNYELSYTLEINYG